MKVQYRMPVRILLALIVLFGAAILVGNRFLPRSKPIPAQGHILLPQPSTDAQRVAVETGKITNNTDVRDIRGAGYIWGAALKAVHAGSRIAPDGTTLLDVTAMEKSFKGHVSPVDLDNSSASSQFRAEYLAATITAALDLDATYQPALMAILGRLYDNDSDPRISQLSEKQRERERTDLCRLARTELTSALPSTVQDQFQNIFGSPNFLFETMSVAAQNIEFERDEFFSAFNGNAVFRISKDGSLSVTSESSSVAWKKGARAPR
jgi:hypothetical protein